ncbi:MAG: hypothetical protein R3C10_16715 [Pirellulales bacterium]
MLQRPTRPICSSGWDRSRIGQLLNGELMSPFIDEVYQRLQTVWLEGHQRLGIEWADVRDVPTGQVAVGYVDEPDQRPAIVLWMDVKGNVKAAEDLLKKVQTNLIDQGAQREEIESKGVKIVVYTVPPREGLRRNDKAVHFIKDDVLIVAGGVMLAEKLLDRWDGSAADSLAAREPFQAVMNRCSQAVGDAKPAVRWFVDPYPLADALEETAPPKPAPTDESDTGRQIDMVGALRNQGFDAVTGVGGFVRLDEGPIDVLQNTFIYAPKPREKSMGRLTLPNDKLAELPDWVGGNVTSANLISIDAQAGFEIMGKMYEELASTELGDDAVGLFDEIIEGFADDTYGLGTDIRTEIVAKLGRHAVYLGDYTTPITTESDRSLIAIETSDSDTVARALEKLFGEDPTYRKEVVVETVVWHSLGKAADGETVVEEDDFGVPPLHFAVAHGYVFMSTNFEIIRDTLSNAGNGNRLSDAADYQRVSKTLDELGATETCFRGFARSDEANRVTYELVKQNRLADAQSLLGQLAKYLLENNPNGASDGIVDGTTLPEYDAVREYVGPSGMFAVTEDDGWYVAGFILKKESGGNAAAGAK